MARTTNIWIAASDNDIDYVKSVIESGQHSPNDKDNNGYTPIHAAASYGHIELLKYLISKGGNINATDEDGDTPLHSVEDADVARILVEEFKADWKLKNSEGQTVSKHHRFSMIPRPENIKNDPSKKNKLLTNPISLFKSLKKKKTRMNTLSSLHT